MDELDKKIIQIYEDTIVKPMYERRSMRTNMKWATLKKRLKMLKRFRKKKPKKTRFAFNVKLWKKKTKTGGVNGMLKKLLRKIGIKEEREVDYEDKILALAQFLDIDPEDVGQPSWGGYEAEGGEYEVLTDSEADDFARQYIEDSVWAFNTWFLINHIDIEDVNRYFGFSSSYYDEDEEEDIEIDDEEEVFYIHMGMGFEEWLEQEQQKAESSNDTIQNLIGDFDAFVDDAISADGRGHFISFYDGEENEEEVNGTDYYIYRTN